MEDYMKTNICRLVANLPIFIVKYRYPYQFSETLACSDKTFGAYWNIYSKIKSGFKPRSHFLKIHHRYIKIFKTLSIFILKNLIKKENFDKILEDRSYHTDFETWEREWQRQFIHVDITSGSNSQASATINDRTPLSLRNTTWLQKKRCSADETSSYVAWTKRQEATLMIHNGCIRYVQSF